MDEILVVVAISCCLVSIFYAMQQRHRCLAVERRLRFTEQTLEQEFDLERRIKQRLESQFQEKQPGKFLNAEENSKFLQPESKSPWPPIAENHMAVFLLGKFLLLSNKIKEIPQSKQAEPSLEKALAFKKNMETLTVDDLKEDLCKDLYAMNQFLEAQMNSEGIV